MKIIKLNLTDPACLWHRILHSIFFVTDISVRPCDLPGEREVLQELNAERNHKAMFFFTNTKSTHNWHGSCQAGNAGGQICHGIFPLRIGVANSRDTWKHYKSIVNHHAFEIQKSEVNPVTDRRDTSPQCR